MLLRQLEKELEKRGEELGLPLSMAAGYSIVGPDQLTNIEKAIDQADRKMYEAKNIMEHDF